MKSHSLHVDGNSDLLDKVYRSLSSKVKKFLKFMASILSICDCTSVYNVFFSSLVKLGFNKITFVFIIIVMNALVRDLWPTLYIVNSFV